MGKRKEVNCAKCKRQINILKERYVLLGTYNKKEVIDESYFHSLCFKEWHESKVQEKAQNILSDMQKKAVSFVGQTLNNLMRKQ